MSGIIDFDRCFYFSMSDKTSFAGAQWSFDYKSLLDELLSTRPDLIPSVSSTPNQASPETSCDTSGASIQHPSMQQMPHDGQYQTFDSCMQQSSFVAQQQQQPDQQQQQHDHMSQMTQQHHQPQGQLSFNMNDLMHSAFLELRMIVEWARKVPKFASLQMGDRVSMLKSSFVDLYLLRLLFRSTSSSGRLMFTKEMIMTSDECVALGWSPGVIMSCFSLVDQLKRLELDLTEFAVLCSIILFYPDAPSLCNRSQVMDWQNQLISCLQQYSYFRFPANAARPGKMILRLAGIRSVSSGILHQFMRCTREGQVQMDALVIEMMS